MKLNQVRSLLLVGLMLLACAPGIASLFPYNVVMDTTSVNGNAGGIYLQFNPGTNSDPASVWITDFVIAGPGGLTGFPVTTGDVSGALDSPPLMITNTNGLNDYFQFLTYGTGISFRVTFVLPDPLTGDSGSTFSFGLTAEDGLTPILTEDPSGFIGQIGYDQTGAFTATPLSGAVSVNEVPEPGPLTLVGLGLTAGWACLARRRHRQPRRH